MQTGFISAAFPPRRLTPNPRPWYLATAPVRLITCHFLPTHNSIRLTRQTRHSRPVTQSHPYPFSSLADKRQWLHSVTFIPSLCGREMGRWGARGVNCGRLLLDQISPPAISPHCQLPPWLLRACWHLKCESLVQQRSKVRRLQISKWWHVLDGDIFLFAVSPQKIIQPSEVIFYVLFLRQSDCRGSRRWTNASSWGSWIKICPTHRRYLEPLPFNLCSTETHSRPGVKPWVS